MYRYRLWLIGVGVALCLGGAGLWWWQTQNALLLPSTIMQKINGFTPYFYVTNIPAGYTVDQKTMVYENGVLMVPLAKKDSPNVVITEQAMPTRVTKEELQKNGKAVSETAQPATINDIEGHLVGTMVDAGNHTLVMINSPSESNNADITLLLQGLRPLR